MEYQRLGLTNLKVSRIGFGCWAIGGHGYGVVNDDESIKAVRKALDLGINFFDTADVYGFGHSESILGKALGKQKSKVVVATKFGVSWNQDCKTFKDCSPKRIKEALEGSLRRLKMDCIPLYQIHWDDKKTPIEDVMEALLKARDSGKILHIGCCSFSEDLVAKASSICRLEAYQCLYNLANRKNESVIKYVSDNLSMSALVYGVIGRGVFSGKYNKNSRFEKKDTRIKDPDFYGEQYNKNIAITGELSKIGKKYGKTSVQVAIRWVLENPNIVSIIGTKNTQQVCENAASISWSLDKSDMELIDSVVLKN